jgi:hypothetical protein
MNKQIYLSLLFILTTACDPAATTSAGPGNSTANPSITAGAFHVVGNLESKKLDEASGIQAISSGDFLLHNDEGRKLFIIDPIGKHRGRIRVNNAKNKDWEDITRVTGEQGPLIVIGDTGDNRAGRKSVRLYFVPEPAPDAATGTYPDELDPVHRLKVRYPDGPRDVESIAFDAASGMILLLSKRNNPPRLYGIDLERALAETEVEAEFLAEVPGFRPPTQQDLLRSPRRGMWVSQPTGMDISADGRLAAVLTYRSLYVFKRASDETWAEAFQHEPSEYIGPPGVHDEALSFSHDQKSIYVTTERRPAPLYRLDLP